MPNKDNDQNWSQVRETILMINTAVARVEYSMIEGNDSVTALSQSFIEIVNSTNEIGQVASTLPDSPEKADVEVRCEKIAHDMQNAIVAFQFYDKLSQRLTHVSKSLEALTDILGSPDKVKDKDAWVELQNMIRSRYTLDADQKMFNDVLSGVTIEEALKIAQQKVSDDDIELF